MTSAASTMEDATAACDAALSELEEAASSLLSAASEIIAQPPPPPPPLGLEKGPLIHFSLITCERFFHHRVKSTSKICKISTERV